MSESSVVARDNGVLEVNGRLTFQTVPEVLAQAAQGLNRAGSAITVDLRNVALIDTAGVALMLEWLGQARAQKRTLTFVNLPEQVRHLIGVSGLDEAFGLS